MTLKKTANLVALLLMPLLLASCSLLDTTASPREATTLERIDDAAGELIASARDRIDTQQPIIATTLVNVDQLGQSSTLGRTLSEAFTSRLVQAGLNVVEVKLRDSLYIEENTGELILSRNVQRLGQDYNADAVLVGTYAQAQNQVFINVRLVKIANRTILGATSFSLPLTNDLRYMLPVSYR